MIPPYFIATIYPFQHKWVFMLKTVGYYIPNIFQAVPSFKDGVIVLQFSPFCVQQTTNKQHVWFFIFVLLRHWSATGNIVRIVNWLVIKTGNLLVEPRTFKNNNILLCFRINSSCAADAAVTLTLKLVAREPWIQWHHISSWNYCWCKQRWRQSERTGPAGLIISYPSSVAWSDCPTYGDSPMSVFKVEVVSILIYKTQGLNIIN